MTNQEFIESIRLEGEEWRDVVGFEGRYMVSSFGRVASLYRQRMRSDGVLHHSEQVLMKPSIRAPRGIEYAVIYFLRDDQTRVRTSVHREVAKAFIPNPNNYPNVDHIDANSINNRVENLRWCTQLMNSNNPISLQKLRAAMAARKGVPNVPLEKSVAQLKDGKLVRIYRSMALCKKDGFSHSAVCRCCRGQKPQYKGYKWMYLSDYEKLQGSTSKNSNP